MVAGISLTTYELGAFIKVPDHLNATPDKAFDLRLRLGDPIVAWEDDRYEGYERPEISAISHSIPMSIYGALSRDELCKVRFSTRLMMDQSVEDAFDTDPGLTIYHKITNSMWRWGYGRPAWNEVVDVYEGIRRFDLGHPGFELTLDHSTSCNECGYSEHSRTYLDGVFGYLVHYRGEHVMTLGFSVMEGRRLLIQQVQLKSRRGNRWLFRLPRNYLEHVIERFQVAFPSHDLFLVDGRAVMNRSLSSYRGALARTEESLAETAKRLTRCRASDEAHLRRWQEKDTQRALELRATIAHAEAEVDRIAAFYDATGRFRRGKDLKVNGLTHHALKTSHAHQ